MEELRNLETLLNDIQAKFGNMPFPTARIPQLRQLLEKGWSEDLAEYQDLEAFKPYFTTQDPMTQKLFKLFLLRKMFMQFKHEPHLFEGGINWFDATRKTVIGQFDALTQSANPPFTYFGTTIRSLKDLQQQTKVEKNPRRPTDTHTVGTGIMACVLLSHYVRNLRGQLDDNIRFPMLGVFTLALFVLLAELTYGMVANLHYETQERLAHNRFAKHFLFITEEEIYKLQPISGKAKAIQERLPELANSKYRLQTDKVSVNNFKLIIEKGWDASLDPKTTLAEFKPGNDPVEHFLIRLCLLKMMTQVYVEKKKQSGKIDIDGKWFADQKAALLAELARKPAMTRHNRMIGAMEASIVSIPLEFAARSAGASSYALAVYVVCMVYGFGSMLGYITPASVRARDYFYPNPQQAELNRWQELLKFSKTPEFQDFLASAEELAELGSSKAMTTQQLLVQRKG